MAIATAFIAIADLRHDLMQFFGYFMVTKSDLGLEFISAIRFRSKKLLSESLSIMAR